MTENKLQLEVGDIIWHRAYDFFGRVNDVHCSIHIYDARTDFTVQVIGELSQTTERWMKTSDYSIEDVENIEWLYESLWFVKVNDFSEQTRLALLLTKFKE